MATLSSSPFSVKTSCDFIINSVRDSSLNCSLQETPYSLYLTIRKTFSKASLSSEQNSSQSLPSLGGDQTQTEINTLKQKLEYVQESNKSLEHYFTEAVDECEQCHVQIKNLEYTIDEMKKDFDKEDLRKVVRESKTKDELIDQLKIKTDNLEEDLKVAERN